MINILFLWTTPFTDPSSLDPRGTDPSGHDNGVVHNRILDDVRRLSYWKCRHDHNGRDGGHRASKDSNGRSKETYRVRLDNLKP
jgi:hypothetical protein